MEKDSRHSRFQEDKAALGAVVEAQLTAREMVLEDRQRRRQHAQAYDRSQQDFLQENASRAAWAESEATAREAGARLTLQRVFRGFLGRRKVAKLAAAEQAYVAQAMAREADASLALQRVFREFSPRLAAAHLAVLQAHFGAAAADAKQHASTLAATQTELAAAVAEKDALLASSAAREVRVAELEGELAAATTASADAEASAKSVVSSELSSQLGVVVAEKDALLKSSAAREVRVAELEGELAAATAASALLRTTQFAVRSSQLKLAAVVAEKDALTKSSAALEARVAELEGASATANAASADAAANAESTASELLSQLEAVVAEKDALGESSAALEARVAEGEASAAAAREAAAAAADALTQRVAELAAELTTAQASLSESRATADSAGAEDAARCEKLEADFAAAQAAHEKYRNRAHTAIKKAAADRKIAEESVSAVQGEALAQLQTHAATATEAKSALEAEVAALKSQLADSKEDAADLSRPSADLSICGVASAAEVTEQVVVIWLTGIPGVGKMVVSLADRNLSILAFLHRICNQCDDPSDFHATYCGVNMVHSSLSLGDDDRPQTLGAMFDQWGAGGTLAVVFNGNGGVKSGRSKQLGGARQAKQQRTVMGPLSRITPSLPTSTSPGTGSRRTSTSSGAPPQYSRMERPELLKTCRDLAKKLKAANRALTAKQNQKVHRSSTPPPPPPPPPTPPPPPPSLQPQPLQLPIPSSPLASRHITSSRVP